MFDLLFPTAEYAEDQQYSKPILYLHVSLKCMEIGSLVGMTVGSLIGGWRRRPMLAYASRGAFYGWASGSLMGPFLVMGKMKSAGSEEIAWKDRAWRLQRNPLVQTSDRFSLVGMGVGACMGPVLLGLGLGGGLGLGTAAGLTAFVVQKQVRGMNA